MKSKILLLEINEIPWKVIKKYKNKFSNIKLFFDKSDEYTTVCSDKAGMLDPWLIWPTVHRGMNYKEHNIRNLGQDPSTFKGTPIWSEYINNGYPVGVFGSLQSWPPIYPGLDGFYIPDTFSQNEECYPKEFEFFQKFNLEQVSQNGRVVKKNNFFSLKYLILLSKLLKVISIKTFFRLFFQLIIERFNSDFYARRPIFQGIIAWDTFKKLYFKKEKPIFATFFTNHIANIMHRYWKDVFPEDFDKDKSLHKTKHKKTMDFAMKVLDEILFDCIKLSKKESNLKIFFLSGMGQAAIKYKNHSGYEAAVESVDKLMYTLGIDNENYIKLLAMVPQIAIAIEDKVMRENVIEKINLLKTLSGEKIFSVLANGNSLSISIITTSKKDMEGGFLTYSEEKILWNDAGIIFNKVEPGTAYHIPEGSMAILNADYKYKDIMTAGLKNIIIKESGYFNR